MEPADDHLLGARSRQVAFKNLQEELNEKFAKARQNPDLRCISPSAAGSTTCSAKTRLMLCRVPWCSGCCNLHLCEFYLFDKDCPFSGERNECHYGHDMFSEHNTKVLKEHNLQGVRKDILRSQLQNEFDITDSKGIDELEEQQDRAATLRHMKGKISSLMGMMSIRMQDSSKHPSIRTLWDQGETEICLLHIINGCKQGRCEKVHFNMPYKWEYKSGDGWVACQDNEKIEHDYSNPERTSSTGRVCINFDSMTCSSGEVRRISTPPSVTQPNNVLTTKWVWYWKDNIGQWNQYESSDGIYLNSSISSDELETQYQEDNAAIIEFKVNRHTYELNVKAMIQRNKHFGTQRQVRRRPLFVSAMEVQSIQLRFSQKGKVIPLHWDMRDMPEMGFKRVRLAEFSDEFVRIFQLFNKTMSNVKVNYIERVQNQVLWEAFQWQGDLMRKTNGKANEQMLFHGTDSKHTEAICQQNFDWRICGTHGTTYGKGSYFARDAQYSHKFTGTSGFRAMFVCRVLVGDYTNGHSRYLRPPAKDEAKNIFYDSCVDNVDSPSIFVIFEKHQVYPEYLIHYESGSLDAVHYRTKASPSSGLSKDRLSLPQSWHQSKSNLP